MKKNLLIILVAIVLVGLAFYGGTVYGQKNSRVSLGGRLGDLSNLTAEQQQQMAERSGAGFGSRNPANINNGEVMAIDEQTITLKLRDGGSKIIFFSDSTNISKTAEGTINDLTIGVNVVVEGKSNEDGSITAQFIRINAEPIRAPIIEPTN